MGSVGPRRGEHEAAVDPRQVSVGQRTVMAGRRAGPAWSSDSGPQSAFSAEAPAQVRWRASGGLIRWASTLAAPGQDTLAAGDEPEPSWSAPGVSQTAPYVGAQMATTAPVSRETSSSDGGVIIPPAADRPEAGRLPIFASVESHWFRGGRTTPGSSGPTAVTPNPWSSPADEGWQAATTVDSPSSKGSTSAGLPKRLPNANLVPGTIPSTQPVAPPTRSAAEARARLAGLQRGISKGRAAASEAANADGEDES